MYILGEPRSNRHFDPFSHVQVYWFSSTDWQEQPASERQRVFGTGSARNRMIKCKNVKKSFDKSKPRQDIFKEKYYANLTDASLFIRIQHISLRTSTFDSFVVEWQTRMTASAIAVGTQSWKKNLIIVIVIIIIIIEFLPSLCKSFVANIETQKGIDYTHFLSRVWEIEDQPCPLHCGNVFTHCLSRQNRVSTSSTNS